MRGLTTFSTAAPPSRTADIPVRPWDCSEIYRHKTRPIQQGQVRDPTLLGAVRPAQERSDTSMGRPINLVRTGIFPDPREKFHRSYHLAERIDYSRLCQKNECLDQDRRPNRSTNWLVGLRVSFFNRFIKPARSVHAPFGLRLRRISFRCTSDHVTPSHWPKEGFYLNSRRHRTGARNRNLLSSGRSDDFSIRIC